MTHYLIRHADAVPNRDDSIRELSARGRSQVAALCASLRDTAFQPVEIWHSPLVRARETAVLLASGLGHSAALIEMEGLQPEDDPDGVAQALEAETRDIAVVGHEPHLGILAALMMGGESSGASFSFPKAGVLALQRIRRRWLGEWIARQP